MGQGPGSRLPTSAGRRQAPTAVWAAWPGLAWPGLARLGPGGVNPPPAAAPADADLRIHAGQRLRSAGGLHQPGRRGGGGERLLDRGARRQRATAAAPALRRCREAATRVLPAPLTPPNSHGVAHHLMLRAAPRTPHPADGAERAGGPAGTEDPTGLGPEGPAVQPGSVRRGAHKGGGGSGRAGPKPQLCSLAAWGGGAIRHWQGGPQRPRRSGGRPPGPCPSDCPREAAVAGGAAG